MTTDRAAEIERRLRAAFDPDEILIKDQSHLHAGHAGAQEGKGHFVVKIVSKAFLGHNRLSRHRMIYDALGNLMQTDIHALTITATAPTDN